MKQPALFFIPFGAIYLLWNDLYRRRILKEILLRNLIFWDRCNCSPRSYLSDSMARRCIDKFWFWTVSYAGQYGSFLIGEIYNGRWPLSRAVQVFARHIMEAIGAGWMLWALAGLGLIVGLLEKKSRANTGFLVGLLRILGFGGVPGTLVSAALLYYDPASDLAPCWRCNKQTVRFSDRSNNCSWIRPTLSAWRGAKHATGTGTNESSSGFLQLTLAGSFTPRIHSSSPSGSQIIYANIRARMIQSQCWDRSRRFIFIHTDIRRPDTFTLTA